MRVSRGSHCAFPRCQNNKGKCPQLSFFSFPKDPERLRKWALAAEREDLLLKDPLHVHKNCTLCAIHFEDRMFMNIYERKRLVHTAVPTLFFGKREIPGNEVSSMFSKEQEIPRSGVSPLLLEKAEISASEAPGSCSSWRDHIRREHSYCRILDDEEDECIEALDVVETILPLDESMDLAYSWSSSLKMSPGGSPEMPLGSPESYILPD